MTAALRALLVMAMLLAGFAAKGVLIAPPAASSSSTRFDTDRAAARLQRILGDQRPHPVDSPGDDAVRDRLIAELRAIGLNPQVHQATDCSQIPKMRFVSCSHVRNVIAQLPGRRPGPHLLLNAHYDSTPTGPGAGDDGLGVAVMLEVADILRQSPPARAVTLLFNEGEEFGLNGAHAFVTADPESRDIDSLINIDVRGVSGPALMHETSDPNGAAIGIYARATQRPFANSISTDFAKLIPNTTDVVFFKPKGWTLLNYGIIGNETRYHSPGDTVQALSRDSLGHVGREVLAATQVMAATELPSMRAGGRVVFTDVAGRGLIRMPILLAALGLGLLLCVAVLLCWRRRALGRPLGIVAGAAFGGMAIAAFVALLLTVLRAGDFWRAYPLVLYLAIYGTLLLGMAILLARFGRNVGTDRLRPAVWLVILLLGGALSLILPGATIFFLIAPGLALAGIAASDRAPLLGALLNLAAMLVQFIMLAELLALVEVLLVDGPIAAVVPVAALAALPILVELDRGALRPAIILAGLSAFGFSAAALAMPRASSERPLGFSIDYFRDLAGNSAQWSVATKQAPLPADFPGNWSRGVLPYNGRTRWISPAPILPTPVPSARLIASQASGPGRRMQIELATGGGDSITLRFPEDAKVLALGLPGRAVRMTEHGEPRKALLRCSGRSCEGLRIEIVLGDRRPVKAELFSMRPGLPREGAPLVARRPANAIAQYAPDQTITRSVIRL